MGYGCGEMILFVMFVCLLWCGVLWCVVLFDWIGLDCCFLSFFLSFFFSVGMSVSFGYTGLCTDLLEYGWMDGWYEGYSIYEVMFFSPLFENIVGWEVVDGDWDDGEV